MSLLGIDAGTTSCKAVAFDLKGNVLATASREYALSTPAPGHLELDANSVWEAVCATVRQVNGAMYDPVTALAVSAQGEAVTPVAADGTVLAGSPVTFDTRAIAQATRLEEAIGRERLAAITGQPPHAMFTIAKLMWWAENAPGLLERTWKFLCFGDFISLRLGAQPVIDYSMAARTMAFDIHSRAWSPDILAAAGIPAEKLPCPAPSGTVIGRVSPELAADLGFVCQPAIVTGGHDQPCGAFGAQATAPGEAMFAIGTTICLAPVFAQPEPRLTAFDYPCYPHVVPERWISLAGNFTGGSLLRWFRDVFGEPEMLHALMSGQDVYEILTSEAGDAPSPLFVLPHFAGSGAPHNDPHSKGAVIGLGFDTTRAQVIRALLEGVMFEMALNREALAAAGIAVDRAIAIGGGTRSDRWLTIAADILGIPIVRAAQTEAACWGAARLAGIGAGLLAWEDSSDRAMVQAFLPDAERREYYRGRLDIYRELYGALRPINARIQEE